MRQLMKLIIYKKITWLSFNTLKNAVNASTCSVEEFIKLKHIIGSPALGSSNFVTGYVAGAGGAGGIVNG